MKYFQLFHNQCVYVLERAHFDTKLASLDKEQFSTHVYVASLFWPLTGFNSSSAVP